MNVIGISISEDKQQPRRALDSCVLRADYGIEGDRFAGPGERQVSLFSAKAKQLLEQSEQGGLCFKRFGGNFLTQGLDFYELAVGDKLQMGQAVIEITQVGKECFEECSLFLSGAHCPLTVGCAFGKVMQGGEVHAGDEICLL